MVSWDSAKIHTVRSQVHPAKFEIKIRTFRPFARLQQSYSSRIGERLVTMKGGVNDEICIVRTVAVSILCTGSGKLPDGALDLSPRFLQPFQKVCGILFHIGLQKVREVIFDPASIAAIEQRILVVSAIMRVKHGEKRNFFTFHADLPRNLIGDHRSE